MKEIEATVKRVILDMIEIDQLDGTTQLLDNWLSSLELINILIDLEEIYEISLIDETTDMSHFETVNSLSNYIQEKVNAK